MSVIVPCLGHAGELAKCLEGLALQTLDGPFEVIVVDSASDPDVAKAVAAFPGVRLVRSKSLLDPGQARNLGARHARGDYFAFTDADCVPEPGFLAAACKALDAGGSLVGGPVLDGLPFHPVAVADNLLQFADFPPNRPEGPASYFPGCNIAIRRAAFFEIDGFPDTGIPAGEDTRFSEAAASRWPGRVHFVRDMRVRHKGRTDLRGFWRHQSFFGYTRGLLGTKLSPAYRRLGRFRIMTVPVLCRRLGYIVYRVARWNPAGLLRVPLLFPLLVAGLFAWAEGFRRGCLAASKETP